MQRAPVVVRLPHIHQHYIHGRRLNAANILVTLDFEDGVARVQLSKYGPVRPSA
jgi:hypothetical protein